ncbi:MAG: hypothetical protein ACLFUJ_06285 [Phycisphaerae bacterium]
MSNNRTDDEILLLSYLHDECSQEQQRQVRQRLQSDESFARLHEDLLHAGQAIALVPVQEGPEDLVERTMAKIQAARRTEALLAREELSSRGQSRPTFSMKEAVAMIAALILMAVIFIPSIQSARSRGAQNLCAAQVGQIGAGIQSFAVDNQQRLPAPEAAQRSRWLPARSEPYTSNSSGLFRLIREHYAAARLFQDPAVGTESFRPTREMTDFPAERYIHYSYQHMLGDEPLRTDAIGQAIEEMGILADATPLFEDGRFVPERLHARTSRNHGSTGQTVLYLNGATRWVESPDVGVDGNNIFQAEQTFEYNGDESPAGPKDTFLLPAFVRE